MGAWGPFYYSTEFINWVKTGPLEAQIPDGGRGGFRVIYGVGPILLLDNKLIE